MRKNTEFLIIHKKNHHSQGIFFSSYYFSFLSKRNIEQNYSLLNLKKNKHYFSFLLFYSCTFLSYMFLLSLERSPADMVVYCGCSLMFKWAIAESPRQMVPLYWPKFKPLHISLSWSISHLQVFPPSIDLP